MLAAVQLVYVEGLVVEVVEVRAVAEVQGLGAQLVVVAQLVQAEDLRVEL